MPEFIEPQLCETLSRPPAGQDCGPRNQIRRLSGPVAVLKPAPVTLKTRKGLDWTEKFSAIEKEGSRLPDVVIDGEIVALGDNGAPDFAALQAALSERRTKDLIFFAFDLLFDDAGDLRELPLSTRKERLSEMLNSGDRGELSAYSLCRTLRQWR